MSDLQLLPCPFCGCTNISLKGQSNVEGLARPSCDDCGALAPTINDWNSRTSPRPKAIYYTEEGVAVSGSGLEHLRPAPKLQG